MHSKDQSGFTLLELTVAMLITSLIVLAIASSLAAISDSWDRGERRGVTREVVRVLQRRLGVELASLGRGPFGAKPGFSGDKQGFVFTAIDDRGPRQLSLAVNQGRLVLTDEPARSPASREEIPLADQVDHLDVSYYDPSERIWLGDWTAKEVGRPPSLVRLRVYFGDAGHLRGSPMLVLPIYAGRVVSDREVDPLD